LDEELPLLGDASEAVVDFALQAGAFVVADKVFLILKKDYVGC